MCFGTSTLGAGAKACLESRMKKFTPHFVYIVYTGVPPQQLQGHSIGNINPSIAYLWFLRYIQLRTLIYVLGLIYLLGYYVFYQKFFGTQLFFVFFMCFFWGEIGYQKTSWEIVCNPINL